MAKQGRGARNKGARFEREVASLFSKYWKAEANRVAFSGALHRGQGFEAGDVTLDYTSGFPFVIECKNHETWNFQDIYLNNKSFTIFWQQVAVDAKRVNKDPLLIFSKNYADNYVIIPFTNDAFVGILNNDKPVSTYPLSYIDPVTDEKKTYLVILTTFDGFSSLPKEFYKENYGVDNWDWEKETEVILSEQKETTMKDSGLNIMNQLFGED